MRAELLNRLAAIPRLRHQDHVGLNRDESGDSVTNERMVVDRENPNPRAATSQGASPLSCAGMPEPDSRDHQERLRAVA